VRADGVVDLPPATDEHLRFKEGVEDFEVQQLVSQFAVEALHVAVIPWRSRLDGERLHPDPLEPFANPLGGELAAVVAADVVRHTVAEQNVMTEKPPVARSKLND
jgi:hypothetical protein